MAINIIRDKVNLGAERVPKALQGTLFATERDAHKFIIEARRDGEKVTLTGDVTASFIRPDHQTVALLGEIEDGCACVTLAQSCYAQTGRFTLTVFIAEDGAKTALYCLTGNVKQTTTDTIVDPGHVVPDVSDIIAEYANMQEAVEDCEEAAAAANQAAQAASGDIAALKATTAKCLTGTNLASGIIYKAKSSAGENDGINNWKISYEDGSDSYQANYKATPFISIAGCTKIVYTRLYSTASNSKGGIFFYDSEKAPIAGSGVSAAFSQATNHYELKTVDVPEGAAYVRCTGRTNLGDIEVYNADEYNATLPATLDADVTEIKGRIDANDADIAGLKNLLDIIEDEHGLINYGYGTTTDKMVRNPSATDATQVGIERYATLVKIDCPDASKDVKVKISGDLGRTTLNTTVDGWDGYLQLVEGKEYKLRVSLVSGTALTDQDVPFIPTVSIYKAFTHVTIATQMGYDETGARIAKFTAPSEKVNLCIFIGANFSYEDCVINVTLQEWVDEQGDGPIVETYFVDELNDTIQKVRNETTSPAIVFMWCTDNHRYSPNASAETFAKMIANMKYIAKNVPVDFVLNTGDLTDGNVAKATTLTRAYTCLSDFRSVGLPYLFSIGNHDINYQTSDDAANFFSMGDCVKAYFTATKKTAYNAAESGTDYYVDFIDAGVRLIVLNANNVDYPPDPTTGNPRYYGYCYGVGTQAWLAAALDTDKKVIIALHQTPNRYHVGSHQKTDDPTPNPDRLQPPPSVLNTIQSFVNNGGSLIMLSGHTHVDLAYIDPWVEVMSECQRFTAREEAFFTPEGAVIENAERAEWNAAHPDEPQKPMLPIGFIDNWTKPGRTAGTYTEDAWNVCVYKPDVDELSVIRFGGGADRYYHVAPIAPTTVTTKLSGTITWTSYDTSVATVSGGVITGVVAGRCAITAKDENGNYECWIVVVE